MLIKPPSRTDLHAAYAVSGCPICGLLNRSERRYIDMTLYEHVTDVKWRAEVRAARGFCTLHTTHVLEVGRSALGVSLVATDLLNTLGQMLAAPGGDGGALGRLRSALGGSAGASPLRPQRPCPICAYLDELGAVYVAALLDDVASDTGRQAYSASAGLCLPHFTAAIERGGAGRAALVEHQRQCWLRLEAELNEFIRKSDHRYSAEPIEAERDAWRRALHLLSGDTRS
jgi:hypothetical protein